METARNSARAAAISLETDIGTAPATVLARVAERLRGEGLSPDGEGALASFLRSDPQILKNLASALETPPDRDEQGPLPQSLWMLAADFLAAAIPIVPFAVLPVAEGRVVSG